MPMRKATSMGTVQTPSKFGVTVHIYVTLLITSGVPSVVTTESTTGITVADTGTGLYTVTFDGGGAARCVHANGCVEGPDSSPTGGLIVAYSNLVLSTTTNSSCIIQCVSTGSTLADPETLSKVRFKLELAEL